MANYGAGIGSFLQGLVGGVGLAQRYGDMQKLWNAKPGQQLPAVPNTATTWSQPVDLSSPQATPLGQPGTDATSAWAKIAQMIGIGDSNSTPGSMNKASSSDIAAAKNLPFIDQP